MKRRQRAARAVSRDVGERRGTRTRPTLPEWAVAGLLLPMVGGASLSGPGEGHRTTAEAASTSASVTVVPTRPELAGRGPVPSPAVAPAVRSAPSGTVPALLWQAYDAAATGASTGCHLPVTLLAAIGQVESGSLRGRALDADHRVVPAVLGPVLDGSRFASIRDTDDGELDGDRHWDRAVGPMQFIPGTWARWQRDGDQDGTADPQDIEDASATAAAYLCAGGRDLATDAGLRSAILSYNHSTSYLTLVLGWKHAFEVIPPETGTIDTVAAAPRPRPARPVAATAVVVEVAAPAVSSPPPPVSAPVPVEPVPSQVVPSEEPVNPPPPADPTPDPTPVPTSDPAPVPAPTTCPGPEPAPAPSPVPTDPGQPSDDPTQLPTDVPTSGPTDGATVEPVTEPTTAPVPDPSDPASGPVLNDPCEAPGATPPAPAP